MPGQSAPQDRTEAVSQADGRPSGGRNRRPVDHLTLSLSQTDFAAIQRRCRESSGLPLDVVATAVARSLLRADLFFDELMRYVHHTPFCAGITVDDPACSCGLSAVVQRRAREAENYRKRVRP